MATNASASDCAGSVTLPLEKVSSVPCKESLLLLYYVDSFVDIAFLGQITKLELSHFTFHVPRVYCIVG